MNSLKRDKNTGLPAPLELKKCLRGAKLFIEERPARKPFGNTFTVCEYPLSPGDLEEPEGLEITWRLAKKSAREFLYVSCVHSAVIIITAKHDTDHDVVIRVLGKFDH